MISALHRILTVSVLSFCLLGLSGLVPGNFWGSALAQSLTPEASRYQVDHSGGSYDRSFTRNSNPDPVETSQNQLKGIADNVREKLNLDEPIPDETKEFFGSVKDSVGEVVQHPQKALKDQFEVESSH